MGSNTLATGGNLPPPQVPIVDPATGYLTDDGYQFFIGLINGQANAIPTASLNPNLKAQGTTQATALPLTAQWNEIDTANAANTGVLLAALAAGQSQTVFNQSGISINVYPPPGMQIDGLGANQAYVLANGLRQMFDFLSASQIRSGD